MNNDCLKYPHIDSEVSIIDPNCNSYENCDKRVEENICEDNEIKEFIENNVDVENINNITIENINDDNVNNNINNTNTENINDNIEDKQNHNVLDENFYVKLKKFYKKRTNHFHLNIEDLISIENNILKLNVKKSIKFLLQDSDEKKYPLVLIENFITIENEGTMIFNKIKYKDTDDIDIDILDKKLFCNTELLQGNLKLFCNLINSVVHKDVETLEHIENFDEFKNNIGLKDGILYSDNYINVNSKNLFLEPKNLLIYFDNNEKSIKYFIRSVDDWWCNIEKDSLKNLNFLKVKKLDFLK